MHPHTPVHSAKSSVSSICSSATSHEASSEATLVPVFPAPLSSIVEETPLGTGSCSTVVRCRLKQRPRHDSLGLLTPPGSPTISSHISLGSASSQIPDVFAVKIPHANRNSKAVLRHEARLLTYLSASEDASKHIVKFHGFLEASDAVVMDVYDFSLESYTTSKTFQDSPHRTSIVAENLLNVAGDLLQSVRWLHQNGTIHGDIKPGNILMRPTRAANMPGGFDFKLLLCDFSSSFCDADNCGDVSLSKMPKWAGGGTYDFMSPRLFTGSGAGSPPTEDDDGYSAIMTVLWFLLGASPYKNADGSRPMKLEWIKKNDPVAFALADSDLDKRFLAVEAAADFDVRRWFRTGFQPGGWRAHALALLPAI